MILDKKGNVTIVSQENTDINAFKSNLIAALDKLSKENVIVNLFSFDALSVDQVLEFLPLSDKHRAGKQSFVVVTPKVSYEEVPETLCVVPTLEEAKDFVEMEEIERDLGF